MRIGAKMVMQQQENCKTQRMDPQKRFFSKRAQDFDLLKQVPESSEQTVCFGRNQYIGTLILS